MSAKELSMENMRRRRLELVEPEPGTAGSIEQQLDMVEGGGLRGDEILRSGQDSLNLNMDMSEPDREGSEMSGDEHSNGLQGRDTGEKDAPETDNVADGIVAPEVAGQDFTIPRGLRFRADRDDPAETERRRERAEEMRNKNRARARRR